MSKSWLCDFCNKDGLTIAKDGNVYCRFCSKSYHETIYDLAKKLINETKSLSKPKGGKS